MATLPPCLLTLSVRPVRLQLVARDPSVRPSGMPKLLDSPSPQFSLGVLVRTK